MKSESIYNCIIYIVLFLFFWKLFGEPSYMAIMQKQDVVIKESKSVIATFPAISVCLVQIFVLTVKFFLFQNGHFKKGLLDDSEDYFKTFTEACGYELSNTSEFYHCVQNQSYTEKDLILGTVKAK